MKIYRVSFFLLAIVFLCLQGVSSSLQQWLTISDVMTGEERTAIGINSMTVKQKAALEAWINRHTNLVISMAKTIDSQASSKDSPPFQSAVKPSSRIYLEVGEKHWIKSKVSDGSIVTLEDGSMWEIHSSDRMYTRLWLKITNIMVLEAKDTVDDYRYLLINTDDGEKVFAKYLGKG